MLGEGQSISSARIFVRQARTVASTAVAHAEGAPRLRRAMRELSPPQPNQSDSSPPHRRRQNLPRRSTRVTSPTGVCLQLVWRGCLGWGEGSIYLKNVCMYLTEKKGLLAIVETAFLRWAAFRRLCHDFDRALDARYVYLPVLTPFKACIQCLASPFCTVSTAVHATPSQSTAKMWRSLHGIMRTLRPCTDMCMCTAVMYSKQHARKKKI